MSFKKQDIFPLIFSFLFILSLFGGVYMHELTHKVIFNNYGLKAKILLFSNFPNAVTVANGFCKGDCLFLQNLNEIFTYNLQDLKFIVGIGFLFVIILLSSIYRELIKLNKNLKNKER